MTVQTTTPNLPAVTSADYPGLSGVEQWLAAANTAAELARQLVPSFFVPTAYKPDPRNGGVEVAIANATGAILLGQSLGLDPLTALQQIYVVHGRPGMYSKMKVALAQRDGHRIWEEEYSPERSTWAGQRKGSEDVVRITLTIEDAKRAGWTSNAAYAKTPADMLAARCSSRVVDRVAADSLFGLRSVEDLEDGPEPGPTAVQVTAADVQAPPRRGAPSALLGALTHREAEASVALDGDTQSYPDTASSEVPEPETSQVTDDDVIDAKQWTAINARFVELRDGGIGAVGGPGAQANRLAVINHVTGRPVAKGSELTRGEAQLVLDTLAGSAGERLARAVLAPAAAVAEAYNADTQDADSAAETTALADGEIDPTITDPWAGAEDADRVGP